MRYELDKMEVLKTLKGNETPIFQKYHDSVDGTRENTLWRALH